MTPSTTAQRYGILSADDVAATIDAAVAVQKAFSLVRLGDGEGALLAFNKKSRLEDYAYLATHFGGHASITDILFFRKLLKSAIDGADLIGVRDDVLNAGSNADVVDLDDDHFFEQFLAAFPLREAERGNLDPHGARRIFQLWQSTRDWLPQFRGRICSQWINADLQLQGYWGKLIRSQERIGLINSSATLADRIRKRFRVDVDFVHVPDKAIDLARRGTSISPKAQHSSKFIELSLSIPDPQAGQVFFVGAGLVGKFYCEIIKRRGGIAIDIGALTDAWDGRATRALVHRSKTPLTESQYGPPPEFQLLSPALYPRRSKKRLMLHAGFSKTGTTSIQEGLRTNTDILKAHRIAYVRAGRSGGDAINHHQLSRAFGVGEREYDQPSPPPDIGLISMLLAQMQQEIEETDFDEYLVSSELLTNFTFPSETEDLYIEWLQSYDTRVVLYVRNQFDWLVSWYTQAAKNGNMGLWLDEFLDRPNQLPNSERFDRNFLRKIEYYANILGPDRVMVRSYEKALQGGGLLRDFFCIFGVSGSLRGDANLRSNASPPDEELIQPILRRRLGMLSDAEIAWDRSLVDRALLRGRYAHRRLELRRAIQAECAATNAEIARRYNVEIDIDVMAAGHN